MKNQAPPGTPPSLPPSLPSPQTSSMITTTREEREEEATIQFKGLKNPTPTHLNKGKLEEERAGRGVGGGNATINGDPSTRRGSKRRRRRRWRGRRRKRRRRFRPAFGGFFVKKMRGWTTTIRWLRLFFSWNNNPPATLSTPFNSRIPPGGGRGGGWEGGKGRGVFEDASVFSMYLNRPLTEIFILLGCKLSPVAFYH